MYYFETLLRVAVVRLLVIINNYLVQYLVDNGLVLRELEPLVAHFVLKEPDAVAIFLEFLPEPVVVVGCNQEVVGAADQGDWEVADGLEVVVGREVLAVGLPV